MEKAEVLSVLGKSYMGVSENRGYLILGSLY